MKKLLLVLAACSGKGEVASPTPVIPPDAAAAPAPDAGPDQAGELPMAQVQDAMVQVRQAIEDDCAGTTAFAGTTKVMITIHPDGTCVADLEQGSGMDTVDQCVIADVGKTHFPTSERGQRFHYSFRFK